MSAVKRYLDTRKQNYAHDVARICAALDMNGWGALAAAIKEDFDAPTLGEQLTAFWSEHEPSQDEIFEACEAMSANLSEGKLRELIATNLCRANGLDPHEKSSAESSAETVGEASATFGGERDAALNDALKSSAQKVDAGPETL